MSVWRYAYFFFFLFVGFIGLPDRPAVHAQPLPVNEQLRDGQQDYIAGRYAEAYQDLAELLLHVPDAPQRADIAFWKARAAIAMQHRLAEHEVRQFMDFFPTDERFRTLLLALGDYFFERTDSNYKRKALNYYTQLSPTAQPQTAAEARLGLRMGLALQGTMHTAYFNSRTKNRENPLHFFDGIKVTRFPQAREARYRAGMIRMEGKRYDEGVRDLKKYLEESGLNAVRRKQYQNAVATLLHYYAQRDDKVAVERLLASFEELPLDKRPDIYLLYRARQAYQKERMEVFSHYIKPYFRRNARLTQPDSLYLVVGYGNAVSEEPQEALDVWDKVAAPQVRRSAVLVYDMGLAYLHLEEYAEADAQFAQLISSNELLGAHRELYHAALRIGIRLAANSGRTDTLDSRTRTYLEVFGANRDIREVLDDYTNTICRFKKWEKGKALLDWYEEFEGKTQPIIEEKRQFIYLESGKDAYRQGDHNEALNHWKQGLHHDASRSYTRRLAFWAAQAHLKLNEPDMAKELLRAIPPKSQTGWKAQYLLGYIYFNKENYTEAKKAFQYAAYPPDNLDVPKSYQFNARLRIADCEAALGHYQAARTAYKELFYDMPEEQDYITFQLGYVYQIENDLSKAASYFQRVTQEYPDSPHWARAVFYLGVLYEEMYRPNDAIAMYRLLLTEEPDNIYISEVLYRKGNTHEYLDQINDAIGMYSRLIQEYPSNQHASGALQALQEFRADGWSVPHLAALERTFREANPDHNEYRVKEKLEEITRMVVHQKNDAALRGLTRLSRENQVEGTKEHNRYFYLLGLIYEQKGDTSQAHTYYNRLDTKIDVEYLRRGWKQQFPLYHAAGAYEKEAEVLGRLIEIITDKNRLTRYLERLSELYIQLGRLREAEAVLQQMSTLKLDNADFRETLERQITEEKKKY